MTHKVKEMRMRLDEIAAHKDKFNRTTERQDKMPVHKEKEMTHSYVEASRIIGGDNDKEEIIQFLLEHPSDDNGKLVVLPIVGFGGLGKTALAKLVYNDVSIGQHFEKKMWACVSDDFKLEEVLVKIMKSMMDGETYNNLELEQLKIKLRDKIEGKRYLLILDDVWSDDKTKWDELQELLKVGASGSKILVTTRSKKVASIMGTTAEPYTLSGLPHEMCVSLFEKIAFGEGQEKHYPHLRKIGEEIVRKCGGVPLAVRTLASQLHMETDEEVWKRISDSEIWELEQKESDILPALKLSYEQLPSHLKRCFAFCSIFPKDFEFLDFLLVKLWMANGLFQSSNGKEELEDVGKRYIKQLASNGFFQDFENQDIAFTFKMHDLVHDLALLVAKNECLRISSTGKYIPDTIRHLYFSELSDKSQMLSHGSKKVRTVLFENDAEVEVSLLKSIFEKFKYLRAVDLSEVEFRELPIAIGTLRHLRYLNLLGNTSIKRLPDSVFKLQNLETLILGGCDELEEVPNDIKYLVSLRFLFITTKQKCFSKDGIRCLRSLRFLWIMECENLEYLFEGIEGLTNLQSLAIANCNSLISLPQSLKYLIALETLAIGTCEKFIWATEEEKDNQNDIPSSGLKKLLLGHLPELEKFPQWLFRGCVDTLQVIRINDCPNLIQLPDGLQNLKVLQWFSLDNCPAIEERFQQNTGSDWPKISHIPNIKINGIDVKSTNNQGSSYIGIL